MSKVLLGAALEALSRIVHHRRRSALNLATEVEIPTLVHGIVDLIGQGTRPLPNLQVLKIFREVHVVTFYLPLFTNALAAGSLELGAWSPKQIRLTDY